MTLIQRILGIFADDAKVKRRVLAYARAGRSMLWVKAANGPEADRALRVLADYR